VPFRVLPPARAIQGGGQGEIRYLDFAAKGFEMAPSQTIDRVATVISNPNPPTYNAWNTFYLAVMGSPAVLGPELVQVPGGAPQWAPQPLVITPGPMGHLDRSLTPGGLRLTAARWDALYDTIEVRVRNRPGYNAAGFEASPRSIEDDLQQEPLEVLGNLAYRESHWYRFNALPGEAISIRGTTTSKPGNPCNMEVAVFSRDLKLSKLFGDSTGVATTSWKHYVVGKDSYGTAWDDPNTVRETSLMLRGYTSETRDYKLDIRRPGYHRDDDPWPFVPGGG
jgi:hypothetical protein